MTTECSLQTFSEVPLDFSAGMLDFCQKSPFSPQMPEKTFSEIPMDFGTFSERAMDFSEGEIGNFGGFMLIPFRESNGNPSVCVPSAITLELPKNPH